MKIHISLPGGAKIEIAVEKNGTHECFNTICLLIGIFIVGHGLLRFIELLV